jgi:hypothetical protein
MTPDRSSAVAIGGGSGLVVVIVLALLGIRDGVEWLGSSLRVAPYALTRAAVVIFLGSALAILLLVVGASYLSSRLSQRLLSDRTSFLLLPALDFEASADGVLRATGQFSRVRRAVLGWLDVTGSAVRLRMDSAGDGRMACRAQAASRSASVLRSAFKSLGEIELRQEEAAAGGGNR